MALLDHALILPVQVQELSIDYSQCRTAGNNSNGEFSKIPSQYVSSSFKGSGSNCTQGVNNWKGLDTKRTYDGQDVDTFVCSLEFSIPNNLKPPVLLYYRLTNFYQNHRRYVKSLDSDQLKGTAVSNTSLGACSPLDTDKGVDPAGKPYYPCGLIANSVFNDTFSNPKQLNPRDSSDQDGIEYNMTDKGIAWSSDANLYNPTSYKAADIAPPPNWKLRYPNGYTDTNGPPNLKTDEAFQVWMRTAGLPNFSKLAKRNDHDTMACSMYRVDIDDSTSTDCFYPCKLTGNRLCCHQVRRHQISGDIYSKRDGRKESIPRYCIRGCRRNMHCPWGSLHRDTSDQATVCHPVHSDMVVELTPL